MERGKVASAGAAGRERTRQTGDEKLKRGQRRHSHTGVAPGGGKTTAKATAEGIRIDAMEIAATKNRERQRT
jgi:hypothetical protein